MISTPQVYVVATPIGNLDDISFRAVKTLNTVDRIYAEDTRHSHKLLRHLDIKKKLLSLHQHNERKRSHEILEALKQNERIAILSDAGTPAISDPGGRVIAFLVSHGYHASPIPGPSALSAILSVCAFHLDPPNILFVGFLPPQAKAKQKVIERIKTHTGIVVLFESPRRIFSTLTKLAELMPQRPACLGRELSKLHEEIVHTSLEKLVDWAIHKEIKGELSLALGPYNVDSLASIERDKKIKKQLNICIEAGLSQRDAIKAAAVFLDLPKKKIYNLSEHEK